MTFKTKINIINGNIFLKKKHKIENDNLNGKFEKIIMKSSLEWIFFDYEFYLPHQDFAAS